ncbi:hypothetical protein TNCV_4427911 [Trichonephila clavipes]|nr:hypothetical protein TNCV_4427911 [Trichonephila clavipes]
MDVCKCIMPLRHGGTLNSRRAASPLVWLVERERGGRPWPPQDFLPLIGVEPSKIILSPAWCSKLRLTTGVKIPALSRNEFCGLRSDFVRQTPGGRGIPPPHYKTRQNGEHFNHAHPPHQSFDTTGRWEEAKNQSILEEREGNVKKIWREKEEARRRKKRKSSQSSSLHVNLHPSSLSCE